MLGMLVLAIADLTMLLRTADVAAAMWVEAQLGTDRVFAAELQALRPHLGQAALGRQPRRRPGRLRGRGQPPRGQDCHRVQDAYSLRCSPQVHGAARDTVAHAALVAGARAGQRRRQPGGAAPTRAASSPTATSTAPRSPTCSTSWPSWPPTWPASASAARTGSSTARAATTCRRSWPHDPGVDSGLMIAQYTQAAIVSELKRLAVPASVDSIPSSAMQEDHVSMGWSPPASCAAPSTG